MYDLDGLSMMSRTWDLAMYALAKEEFHFTNDQGCVIDGIKLHARETVGELSSKALTKY